MLSLEDWRVVSAGLLGRRRLDMFLSKLTAQQHLQLIIMNSISDLGYRYIHHCYSFATGRLLHVRLLSAP